MKKISILVSALTLTSTLFAQNLTSKKGEAYLPVKGDWALGIDAVPYLEYIGNMFGKSNFTNDGGATTTGNTAPGWNYATMNNTITGKYFVEDKTAYRASLRLGFGSDKMTNKTMDRGSDPVVYPNPVPMKDNVAKSGTTNIALAVGMEMRRGSTRLQGYYGAELGFSLNSTKDTYTYGNTLAPTAANPVNVDLADMMNGGMNLTSDSHGNFARVTERKTSGLGVGLRAFIGAEYFVLPKLALGGEFGWGLMFTSGKTTTSIESVGTDINGTEVVGTETMDGAKMSGFSVDTDAMNSVFGGIGQLRITLHF